MVRVIRQRIALFLALTTAVSQVSGAAPDTDVELALRDNDECIEGPGSCSLQALQVKSLKDSEDSMVHVNCVRGSLAVWKRDISSEYAKAMASRLSPLQNPIKQIAHYLALLDKFVNGTMLVIENATGEEVTFETPEADLLQEEQAIDPDDENLDDEKDSDAWNPSALPPNAAYVNKISTYLEKEIKELWRAETLVDRKRMGVLNGMGSRPYGPHGEHPEVWEPQGFFPCTNCSRYSTVTSAAPESSGPDDEGLPEVSDDWMAVDLNLGSAAESSRTYENFYQCRLVQDYLANKENVRNLQLKVLQLSKELQTAQAAVRRFCNSPSGVYQPCPKDVCLQQ